LRNDVDGLEHYEADYRTRITRAIEADLQSIKDRASVAPGTRPELSNVDFGSHGANGDPNTIELDVRALLDAFNIPGAARAAAGWAGGRLALYTGADGTATVALALRWGSADDAVEWRAAASAYVAEAFPGAAAHVCPAVGGCWVVGDRELAVASSGDATVFASGAAGELVAAALVRSSP